MACWGALKFTGPEIEFTDARIIAVTGAGFYLEQDRLRTTCRLSSLQSGREFVAMPRHDPIITLGGCHESRGITLPQVHVVQR